MTAVAKRQWGPQRTLSEGISSAIDWLEKSKQKNILSHQPPTLYQAYVVGPIAGTLDWARPLSEVFRWSNKDEPAAHRARDAAVRLLSVAFKAHYFLERNEKIAHEPYLFIMPDVANPQTPRFGLIYRLDPSGKTIMVGEGDLGRIASAKLRQGRFPVVLLDGDSARYKWYNMKHWAGLVEQSELFNDPKPWLIKKERDAASLVKDVNQFSYGTVFDIPYHLKDLGPALGMSWATGLKTWYLPHGFDIEPTRKFLEYMIEKHPAPEVSSKK